MQSGDVALGQPQQRERGIAHWRTALPAPTKPAAGLAAIAVLAAALGFWRVSRLGDANTYYAAAVRSMLDSWHAFFFASLDAKGFVTVDKPPVGFWIQIGSAALFGFHGWSILLPEILAAIGSVLVLFALVRRAFGPVAGLIAALALAVAPVNVAVSRNNTPDSLLVFCVLLAAWATVIAAERGNLRWLLVGMALLGLGFNIKMLQAYLVLPALILAYLFATAIPFRRRIGHLALGGVVLIVVSFSWAAIVQLTPASMRPYVGSSANNNVFNLIFGYNGLNRLLPRGWSIFGITNSSSNAALGGFGGGGIGVGGASENGPQGVLRLIDTELGGQIGWLLPMALIGLAAAILSKSWRREPAPRLQLALWAGWLFPQIAFFSVAGFYHRYYLSMLSPAIAALAGIGLVALWRLCRHSHRLFWLLPVATVTVQAWILRDYALWRNRLLPAMVVLAGVAALGLLLGRLPALSHRMPSRVWQGLVVAGLVAMLIAPAAWAAITVSAASTNSMPAAGPSADRGGFGGGLPGRVNRTGPPPAFASFSTRDGGGNRDGSDGRAGVDPSLVTWLEQHQSATTYLVAVESANQAAPIILETNKPVMAMGGFSGHDPILTVDALKKLIGNNTVRYFMVGGRGGGFGGGPLRGDEGGSAMSRWITQTCTAVNTSASQSSAASPGGQGGQSLYDCGSVRSSATGA